MQWKSKIERGDWFYKGSMTKHTWEIKHIQSLLKSLMKKRKLTWLILAIIIQKILKSKLLWIISAWFFSIIFIYKILTFVHGKEDFLPQDSQYLIQTSSNETSRKGDILTTPNCFDALASKVIGWCYHSLR